jgi:hypothetical protein
MTGLRLFKDLKATVASSADLNFYSRRSGGPYYRWRYEKVRSRWQWSRMCALELGDRELVAAHWNGLPAELKSSLSEHYVE